MRTAPRKQKRLLLDCDGVIANFAGRVQALASAAGHPFEVRAYGLASQMPEHVWHEVERAVHGRNFVACLDAYPGEVEAAWELARHTELVFVTSPWRTSVYWAHERAEWLAARFHQPRIISTNQKHMVEGDIFVDDHSEHVNAWADAHPRGIPLLFTRPWNEDARGSFLRINSLRDVFPYLNVAHDNIPAPAQEETP